MAITHRENLLRIFRRQGMEYAPVQFDLCPSLETEFHRRYGAGLNYTEFFDFPWRALDDPRLFTPGQPVDWKEYYSHNLHPNTTIDIWGVAHEPGSAAAMHMTRMHHPMKDYTLMQEFLDYPYPQVSHEGEQQMQEQACRIKQGGYAVLGYLVCTIWETAWYMRSMEQLMMDMMTDDILARFHLDRITEIACERAQMFAGAGVDILFLGDDVGMQQSLMMSRDMYRSWLLPRLKQVVDSARKINPDILIAYHSCGYVTPLIPDFMEAGVDILNPVQPECMDFADIHRMYGDRLSFWGTIGTQTTMPFGTPEAVQAEVSRNLRIAGERGGLLCAPTHLLEPEVPWDNIDAYISACKEYAD